MTTTPITQLLYPGLDTLSAETLLDAVNNTCLVGAIFDHNTPSSSRTYQTTLLGANLVEGELLISEFFPDLSIYDMQTMRDNHFWLKIKKDNTYFFVQVLTIETATTYSIVKIQKAYISQHQHGKPNISFRSRTGPTIEIQPNYSAMQKGWLQNISRDGGVMALYGTRTKNMIRKREKFEVTFQFGHEFNPKWRIKITESTFFRQPCCHLRLRFIFKDLSLIGGRQIDEFVHGFEPQREVHKERPKSAA